MTEDEASATLRGLGIAVEEKRNKNDDLPFQEKVAKRIKSALDGEVRSESKTRRILIPDSSPHSIGPVAPRYRVEFDD
jgi:hypothetical protein